MRRPSRKLWKLRGRRHADANAFAVNERDAAAVDDYRDAPGGRARQAISPDDFDRALVRLLDHS